MLRYPHRRGKPFRNSSRGPEQDKAESCCLTNPVRHHPPSLIHHLPMSWPNNSTWSAGKDKATVAAKRGNVYTWTVPCGSLFVPSGRLAVCDPFTFMRARDNPHIITPTGKFPVTVTLADISPNLD